MGRCSESVVQSTRSGLHTVWACTIQRRVGIASAGMVLCASNEDHSKASTAPVSQSAHLSF